MSVVRVDHWNSFQGTGFVCYSAGQGGKCLAMSSSTVTGGRKYLHVAFPNQAENTGARVLYESNRTSLALLAFTSPAGVEVQELQFAALDTPLDSGRVFARGYNAMRFGQRPLNPGTYSGNILGQPGTGESGNLHYLRCDYTASDGLEGAPVLKDGRIVGVHIMNEGGIRFATSVLSVRSTLQEWLDIGYGDDYQIRDMLEMIAAGA